MHRSNNEELTTTSSKDPSRDLLSKDPSKELSKDLSKDPSKDLSKDQSNGKGYVFPGWGKYAITELTRESFPAACCAKPASASAAAAADKYAHIYCNNCGKTGHSFYQCKLPITSYGIIAVRLNPRTAELEYLMIRRKDTLGFIDFMRGKYSVYNKEYIMNMLKQMTVAEKARLQTQPFDQIWNEIWNKAGAGAGGDALQPQNANASSRFSPDDEYCDPISSPANSYGTEESFSKNKLAMLKKGVVCSNDLYFSRKPSDMVYDYTLDTLIRESNRPDRQWTEPEWGFPKGRRDYQERDYSCAVREFCEETGYPQASLIPVRNILPFEENFMGSNYKSYKHKYYLTYMDFADTCCPHALQTCEVSAAEWKSYAACDLAIRPYNLEKRGVIRCVDETVRTLTIV